ncbi:hypothetical protein JXJ21_19035 [candidate division KSB1 bacterium]|nr:hypothetical protein [candidate division KSB1 bacterium]
MRFKKALSLLGILYSSYLFIGWGYVGHQIINRNSTLSFPPEMAYFLGWADSLAAHGSDADYRGSTDPTEAHKHYIDIDNYPEFVATGRIPQDYEKLVAIHGDSFVSVQGILPWAILATMDSLQAAFSSQRWQRAMLFAADLGHYVGDGHMPLHITRNYNGQYSGQYGIHSRYETGMLNRYSHQISYGGSSIDYVTVSADFVFGFLYENYVFVDSVLQADNAATAIAGNTEDDAYYAALWDESRGFTARLLENASNRIAALIYASWINAGSPIPGIGNIVNASLNLNRGWNMVSFNVIPVDLNVDVVMQPVVDKLVIMKNGDGQAYIPQYGINVIGQIDIEEGYQMYLTDQAALPVTGFEAAPGTTIDLSRGWSLIGYPLDQSMDIRKVLEGIWDKIGLIKNGMGQVVIPAYDIMQFTQMVPGQAYQLYLTEAAILIFP